MCIGCHGRLEGWLRGGWRNSGFKLLQRVNAEAECWLLALACQLFAGQSKAVEVAQYREGDGVATEEFVGYLD